VSRSPFPAPFSGTPRVETAITAIFVFAGASFFFALAETAAVSLGKMAGGAPRGKNPRGKTVARLLEHPQDLSPRSRSETTSPRPMLAVAPHGLQRALDASRSR